MRLSIACPRVPLPPPPPPPGDGGDLTKVGVKCILNPHTGTDEMVNWAPPLHTRRSQCRLASVNVPHPRNSSRGQIPHPRQSEAVKSPVVSGGGGGGTRGLQLIGASKFIRLYDYFDWWLAQIYKKLVDLL